MGGVDLADQFLHTLLPFPHKRNKYPRVIFFAFWKILVNNCFLIARTKFAPKLTMRQYTEMFLNKWIKELLKDTPSINYEEEIFFKKKKMHFPVLLTHDKYCKQMICECCKEKSSHTCYICPDCQVPLHPACWKQYHEQLAIAKQFN
jgi:hypothetical protein